MLWRCYLHRRANVPYRANGETGSQAGRLLEHVASGVVRAFITVTRMTWPSDATATGRQSRCPGTPSPSAFPFLLLDRGDGWSRRRRKVPVMPWLRSSSCGVPLVGCSSFRSRFFRRAREHHTKSGCLIPNLNIGGFNGSCFLGPSIFDLILHLAGVVHYCF